MTKEDKEALPPRPRKTATESSSSSMCLAIEGATNFNAASTIPAGLAQTLDEMSVVLGTKPRSSLADIHVECRGGARDGPLQCFLRFRCAPKLAQRRRGPAVDHRKIGKRTDQSFRGFDRS